MDFTSSDPEATAPMNYDTDEETVGRVLAGVTELLTSKYNQLNLIQPGSTLDLDVEPILISNEVLSADTGCVDVTASFNVAPGFRNDAPMDVSTTSSNDEPVKHDEDMTNSSASSDNKPPSKRRKLSEADRAAAAQKREELKEQRERISLQKQLEREQKKQEINERKALLQAQREAKKAKAAANSKPRRSAPKKTLAENFASTASSLDGEIDSTEDEVSRSSSITSSSGYNSPPKVAVLEVPWGVLDYGFHPIGFAQTHPSGKINTFGPWSVIDLQTYYHYIDCCVMNLECQKLVWDLMLIYRVPIQDPSLHSIGSMPCCAGKSHCPVIFRAKYCFSMRVKLLHLFLYPYMKKLGYMLDSMAIHMWNTLSDPAKEMFYRDNSKVGMYHEYINMMIHFAPSQQERMIFEMCYPKGNRASPFPEPAQVLISVYSYQHNK